MCFRDNGKVLSRGMERERPEESEVKRSVMLLRGQTCNALNVSTKILKSILNLTGNQ